jgi:hypothetical protein
VTKEGGKEYLPPSERIAMFDKDGTLWCEQPVQVQCFFGRERLKAMAAKDPSLKDRQPRVSAAAKACQLQPRRHEGEDAWQTASRNRK